MTVLRYLNQPKAYVAVGGLLIAGSAVAAALTWPPSRATVRPFGVGVLLILRGVVRYLILRWRRRTVAEPEAGSGVAVPRT